MTTKATVSTTGIFEEATDIGLVEHQGSCHYDAEAQAYTMSAAGSNVWGERDACYFVWKKLTGDFIVTMHAQFFGKGQNAHRKLGWMARASLAADAPHASAAFHGGDGLLALQFRPESGASTEEVRLPLVGAEVIQLERRGQHFIMSAAHHGEPFVSVELPDFALPAELYVGIFLCSHEDDVLEKAQMHNVRLVKPASANFDRQKDAFGSHLEILDIASGQRRIIYSEDEVFEAPNWTTDGQALIYNKGGRLYRFNLASAQSTLIDTGDVRRNNNDHVISFDGAKLAISSHDENSASLIYTVPIEGGQPKLITPQGPSYLHGWSPDSAFLVYTAKRQGDFNIYRIPSEGGQEEQLTTGPALDDGPEYSPDGRYIYFNSVRSGSMEIWRMTADGQAQEQLTDDHYNNWFPHISPDGKQIIFLSYLEGEVEASQHPAAKRVYLRMMPVSGGRPSVLAYLYGGQGTINVPSWSPDSRRVAFVSNTVPFA